MSFLSLNQNSMSHFLALVPTRRFSSTSDLPEALLNIDKQTGIFSRLNATRPRGGHGRQFPRPRESPRVSTGLCLPPIPSCLRYTDGHRVRHLYSPHTRTYLVLSTEAFRWSLSSLRLHRMPGGSVWTMVNDHHDQFAVPVLIPV